MLCQSLPKLVLLALLASVLVGCKSKDDAPKPDEQPTPVADASEAKAEAPEEAPKFGYQWANATLDKRKAAFASGDKLADARSLLTYEVLRGARPNPEGEKVGPYALVVKGDKTRDFGREAWMDIRRMRNILVQESREVTGRSLKDRCGTECQRTAVNEALEKFAGAPLFDADGKMNNDALSKLLAAFYVEPDAKLLGLEARDIYAIVKPIVRDIVGIYSGLDAIGREDVMAAYAKALSANPEPASGVNRGLVEFYRLYTRDAEVAKKGGLEPSSTHWTLVSFWLRRMNEGNDKAIRDYLVRGLKAYDTALHDQYFKAAAPPESPTPAEK